MKIGVMGAGGFIGGHLVKRLLDDGHEVRCADIKLRENWWQYHPKAWNLDGCDLRELHRARIAVADNDWIINLAAEAGGVGYIYKHDTDCLASVLINTNLLRASEQAGVGRYFFASSACAYNKDLQDDNYEHGLEESDIEPYRPDTGYGWEKLYSEFVTQAYHRDYGLDIRIARLHNCYGPHGDWWTGREKAPAALCRKIAVAKLTGKTEIEVWGDGKQTRSFMYIDDGVEGIVRLMHSDHKDRHDPVNLGSSEMVSIDFLSDNIQAIAGIEVSHKRVDGPQGVRGRSSDNTKIKEILGWEPEITLYDGLKKTYPWIEEQARVYFPG